MYYCFSFYIYDFHYSKINVTTDNKLYIFYQTHMHSNIHISHIYVSFYIQMAFQLMIYGSFFSVCIFDYIYSRYKTTYSILSTYAYKFSHVTNLLETISLFLIMSCHVHKAVLNMCKRYFSL